MQVISYQARPSFDDPITLVACPAVECSTHCKPATDKEKEVEMVCKKIRFFNHKQRQVT
jgi:hypothetical protein